MIRESISRYRLLEEIGGGGMGVVYRARDEHLGREVAVKVLRAGSTGEGAGGARFRREARTLSLLNHPSICTVFDFDSSDGVDFLVMELVAGERLDQRLGRGPLHGREVAELGAQIAEALGAAHERGVIHRDLKPGNVIVTPKGRVKLLDFGLALLCPGAGASLETRSLTDLGGVVGTIPYMSPEQLLGQEVDERSDLYSLGVLLYEMAAGRRPFTATPATALVNEILHVPAPPVDAAGPGMVPALESLIRNLLEKDPGRRPAPASFVEAELRRLAGADGSGALPAAAAAAAPEPAPERAPGRIRSIVVLPLENLSGDPEQEYFADGMTEALIMNLAQIRALRVVSRTSAMQYKGARKPLPEIARALDVDAVVEGTVAKSGPRVRITAQLIDSAADRHLWARSYERDLSDVLALQSEVARAIAGEIRVQLGPGGEARLGPARRVAPRAYEAYLRGRFHWNRRTEEGLRKGIDYFEEAISIDPAYAQAYAGLAWAYQTLGSYGFVAPAEAFTRARAAAERALELDESLADAHAAMGDALFTHGWDWAGAEKAFRRAIALDPNNAGVFQWWGDFLSAMGRGEEAVGAIRRARELDPLSLTVNTNLGMALFYARRYDESIAQQLRTIELDPTFPPIYRILGGAYEQKGRFEDAIAAYRKGASLSSDLSASALLAHAYAVSGQKDEARRLLRELEAERKGRYLSPYSVAAIHVGLGEPDRALELLERAFESRDRGMVWLKVAPRFDPLRADPRFGDLLRRMKLAA